MENGFKVMRSHLSADGYVHPTKRKAVFSALALLVTLLGFTGQAVAEEWKKIEPKDSALIVAIPPLKEAKPTYFDRAEAQEIRGSESVKVTVDKAGYAANGHVGVFWYEFIEGPGAWRSEGLRAVVEALDWIADKNLVMSPNEQAYFRGNAEGSFRVLTYRPQGVVERPCVVGQYARSGS